MLNAGRLQRSRQRADPLDLAPSNSPKVKLAMLPVWRITPGSAITAAWRDAADDVIAPEHAGQDAGAVAPFPVPGPSSGSSAAAAIPGVARSSTAIAEAADLAVPWVDRS